MFYSVVYFSPLPFLPSSLSSPPYTPIYIYRGTPAAPLLQVKALCREREINSRQLEKWNSLAMFIILPSVLFWGSASEIWMYIQYLT